MGRLCSMSSQLFRKLKHTEALRRTSGGRVSADHPNAEAQKESSLISKPCPPKTPELS